MADLARGEAEQITLDAFFGGRLMLRQPAEGHRSGTDAVLLAAAVPFDFAGLAYDVGAGVGAAGLGLACACPDARVGLIESDAGNVALAAANIDANGLGTRVTVSSVDILLPDRRREMGLDGRADIVITNPPFHDPATIRASPHGGRRAAHVEAAGGIGAWVAACLALLGAKGSMIVIHRADAAPALLRALEGKAGDATLLPVHSHAGQDAKRILVRARKGSRAPFRIAPPLILHDAGGFTAEAERLHRGAGVLRW